MPRFAIAPLGLTTEGSTKFKPKGWKWYLKKLQCTELCMFKNDVATNLTTLPSFGLTAKVAFCFELATTMALNSHWALHPHCEHLNRVWSYWKEFARRCSYVQHYSWTALQYNSGIAMFLHESAVSLPEVGAQQKLFVYCCHDRYALRIWGLTFPSLMFYLSSPWWAERGTR